MGTASTISKPDAAILNIAKPAGCTSRDIVNRIQRVLGRSVRVGHAGTLDPMATGVLLIVVGRATKLIPVIHEFPKSYRAKFTLGQRSDTDDSTGNIREINITEFPERAAVHRHLEKQVGALMQTPPQFSAVKVSGRRAYQAARQGESLDLKPRLVHVFETEIVEYSPPELVVNIRCGSGTYIRSIARDLGDSLGTGALMHGLSRHRIGPFALEDSVAVDLWEEAVNHPEGIQRYWQNVEKLFDNWPQYLLNPDQIENLRHGRRLKITTPHQRMAAFSPDGRFVAILKRGEGDWFKTSINWVPSIY